MFICPISGKLQRLHTSKFQPSRHPSESGVPVFYHPPTPCYKVYLFFLIHTTKGWCKTIMSIGLKLGKLWRLHRKLYSSRDGSSSQITEAPTAVAPQPTTCYKVYMFFLINTTKGWVHLHIFTNPISVSFWPLHTCILYSSTKYESMK